MRRPASAGRFFFVSAPARPIVARHMPRQPRIDFPGLPQHIVLRGNDRQPIFFTDRDRSCFLKHFGDASFARGCDIHAFVLMGNHVHLLATATRSKGLSRMMQDVGRNYVKYVNATYGRTGTLFEGRFKSSLVQTSFYFLACMRYIEMNPARAGIVRGAAEYSWSSYRQNATGDPSGLLTPHPEYLNLGTEVADRGAAYRQLFVERIDPAELAAIRASIRQCRALGGDLYCRAVGATLGRAIAVAPRGRPGA